MTAEEEMHKKQLERDLFGEGEEPLSENQYRSIKTIIEERDHAIAQRDLWIERAAEWQHKTPPGTR